MAKVSIGLPVFNSRNRKLTESIESLLNQTFPDFELIICDNASTDGTYEICRYYAGKDARIRLYRNETNRGALANFHRVLHLAQAEYFMWAADDDFHEPAFISSCLAPMEADKGIALCFPRTTAVLPNGTRTEVKDPLNVIGESPEERFMQALETMRYCYAIYGLHRTGYIRSVRTVSDECRGFDIVYLLELALYGKLIQVNLPLFISGFDTKWLLDMEQRYRELFKFTSLKKNRGITLPTCTLLNEIVQTVKYAPLSLEIKAGLLPRVLYCCLALWKNDLLAEIRRAVELVHQGRFTHDWGDATDTQPLLNDPKFDLLNYVYASEILKRLEETHLVFPLIDEPGLLYAKAVCYAATNRRTEAAHAVQMELNKHPDYKRAKELLDQLENK
jgi:glycosyltransferase involved in cell wall biosynthesis